MTRISGINIPATVRTEGVRKGLKDAQRQVEQFRSSVNRTAEGLGAVGAGRLGAGVRAIGGASGLLGMAGGGLGGAALAGGGLGAFALGGIGAMMQSMMQVQIQARDMVAAGRSNLELLRAGINPALAQSLAMNAPGTPAGPIDAMTQAIGAHRSASSVWSGLRGIGGFIGDVIGQALGGKFPVNPYWGMGMGPAADMLPGSPFANYSRAFGIGRLMSADSVQEAMLTASRDPLLVELYRSMLRSQKQRDAQ